MLESMILHIGYADIPTILPRASGKGRGRTNTLTSIPDESPLMDIITGGKYESDGLKTGNI